MQGLQTCWCDIVNTTLLPQLIWNLCVFPNNLMIGLSSVDTSEGILTLLYVITITCRHYCNMYSCYMHYISSSLLPFSSPTSYLPRSTICITFTLGVICSEHSGLITSTSYTQDTVNHYVTYWEHSYLCKG